MFERVRGWEGQKEQTGIPVCKSELVRKVRTKLAITPQNWWIESSSLVVERVLDVKHMCVIASVQVMTDVRGNSRAMLV